MMDKGLHIIKEDLAEYEQWISDGLRELESYLEKWRLFSEYCEHEDYEQARKC